MDEIDITQDKTVLVIANPHAGGLHPDLLKLHDNVDFKNRICFLTGQRSFDALLNAAKELKAIRHIIAELKVEGAPDNDPQLVQARDLLDRIQNQFGSALRETFSTLYYPSAQRLMAADFPMEFTANKYDGEDQIIRTLKGKMKYTEEVSGETFRKKVEARLFTQKVMLWAAVTWINRITLKGRVFDSGSDKIVELRAAPPAPIRYTTDGSDPRVARGSYDEPFVVPVGARLVLAVAEKQGISSDVLQIAIHWDQREAGKPIDQGKPLTWRPAGGFTFSMTRTAYGFLERMRKHGGKAAVTRIAVLDGQWVDLNLADDFSLDADRIQATVEHLRSLLTEGEVNIEAAALWFPTGQQFLDYVRDAAIEVPCSEVEQ